MKQYLLDTNGILRFLLKDIEEQSAIIRKIFTEAKQGDVYVTIPLLVFAELNFSLKTFYGFSKSEIVSQLGSIVEIPYLDIEKRDILRQALLTYNHSSISFVDAIFQSEAELTGKELVTFDKKLRKKLL